MLLYLISVGYDSSEGLRGGGLGGEGEGGEAGAGGGGGGNRLRSALILRSLCGSYPYCFASYSHCFKIIKLVAIVNFILVIVILVNTKYAEKKI
jgi:hypothetical protein